MTDEIRINKVDVQKLNLKPNDVLVFRFSRKLHSMKFIESFSARIRMVLKELGYPNNSAIILDDDIVMEVITKEEE